MELILAADLDTGMTVLTKGGSRILIDFIQSDEYLVELVGINQKGRIQEHHFDAHELVTIVK